jgi:hypothetical protein
VAGIIRVYVKEVRGTVDREGAVASAREVGRREVTDMTRKIMNRATILCPVDTGFLRAHHQIKIKDLKTQVKGEVTNTAKYAAAVHDGSGPHIIQARKKRALRFTAGGKVVFARAVRHPGAPGRPWLYQAATVAINEGWRFQRAVASE